MRLIEKFYGRFVNLPSTFLQLLDRNFEALTNDLVPAQVSVSGFILTPFDKISSLQVNAASSAITVYLPSQPVGSQRRTVIKTDSSGNVVTVDGNGYNINGSTTASLAGQYDSVTVEPTGTEWLIVAQT
jgi:hypothetical protein